MATLDREEIRKRLAVAQATADRVRRGLPIAIDRSTLPRMLLALALAFGLWAFVTVRQNPDTTVPLAPRPLEARGLAADTVVMTDLPAVSVTIAGPLALVQAPDRPVTPYINLEGRGAGAGQRLPISVDAPPGTRVVGLAPQEVTIDLEPLTQASYPVRLATQAAPPGVRLDQPTIEPSSVTVTGPRASLNRISRVEARLEPVAAGELTRITRPIPVDAGGREVTAPRLSIEPPAVKVTLPAQAATGIKSVPVKINVAGQPAVDHKLDKFEATPSVVNVSGEAAALEQITSLETEPIDISGRRQTLVTQAPLKVPGGVNADPAAVRVEIGISPVQTQQTLTVGTQARGLGPGLRAQVVPGNVAVTLQGPVRQLQGLDVGALRAEVNLQGQRPGTYSIAPTLVGPGLEGLNVEIQPARVTVQIAAEATPTPVAAPTPPATSTPDPAAPTRTP